MKNFLHDGIIITAPAPEGGILGDSGIVVGNIFGVACYSADEGTPVELSTTGVYRLPKAPAAVLTVGARVSWDISTKEVTAPGAGHYPIGVALEDAGNGVSGVAVRLDGVSTAAE